MSIEVIMPQMGESIAEGTITRWLVEVGQQVERDQPLLEISTDKVDAEIPSPASGTLLEVLFAEGDVVEVDKTIARIGDLSEVASSSGAAPAPTSPDSVSRAVPREQVPREPVPQEPVPASSHSAPSPARATSTAAATAESSIRARSSREPDATKERVRSFSSPVVRKIAAEEGVDISLIDGTGIHGRVTKRDILQYLEHRDISGDRAQEVTAVESPASDTKVVQGSAEMVHQAFVPTARVSKRPEELHFSVPAYREGDPVEIEPMSKMRRLTAAHMLYSQQTSAHVTTVFDADLTSLVAARNRAKDGFFEKTGTKLTFMPFIFRAVIDGLRTYPKFNASIDGTQVIYKKQINLGMAVALDWGLIVPVIDQADQLNLVGLATQANDLADRARSKRLRPEEIQGGTFTVTNPGVFGSLFGTPLINQPQVAILCVGAIEKRPVVITDEEGNDGLGIRWMAYLALSYDHRLIDGADAEQFMVRVKQTLTDSSWDELSAYSDPNISMPQTGS